MKILVYKWDIYLYDAIIETLKKQGHFVDVLAFSILNQENTMAFTQEVQQLCKENDYDLFFSVNYYPPLAKLCFEHHIPYAAWTCDSPLLYLEDDSVFLPTNYLFLFDKKDYTTLKNRFLSHVYYLPLAGTYFPPMDDSLTDYQYDISFVGNLYDKNRYEEMCHYLPDYLCGYMDAAIEAQCNIFGGYVLPSMLNDRILTELANYTQMKDSAMSFQQLRLHFATTVLSYKAASLQRIHNLNQLAKHHSVHLFTTSDPSPLLQVHCHGPAAPYKEMPSVVTHSKINLNMTAPNIEDGVPQRVFDILAAGGFLLTDYRSQLCQLFENEKDLVIYQSPSDLLQKADYYLNHTDERETIAKNGQKKVQELHLYEHRISEILHTIFNPL